MEIAKSNRMRRREHKFAYREKRAINFNRKRKGLKAGNWRMGKSWA
jgi:hypothetical protein